MLVQSSNGTPFLFGDSQICHVILENLKIFLKNLGVNLKNVRFTSSNLLFHKGFSITPINIGCNNSCNTTFGSKNSCMFGLKSLTILYIIFLHLINIYFIQLLSIGSFHLIVKLWFC